MLSGAWWMTAASCGKCTACDVVVFNVYVLRVCVKNLVDYKVY